MEKKYSIHMKNQEQAYKKIKTKNIQVQGEETIKTETTTFEHLIFGVQFEHLGDLGW